MIEGKDKTGRRYKYVVGQRGRVKLGLPEEQKGGRAKGPKDVAIRAQAANAIASKQSSVHARAMANKIIKSHAEWEKSGDLYTAGRLSQLFSKGRDKLLKQGNKSEAHRAFAGVVLATIFHSNYHGKKKGGKYNITFNAGGNGKPGYIKFKTKDGKEVGGISFNDITKIGEGDINKARNMFHSLAEKAKGAKPQGHKSSRHEHKAMVQALSVKPTAVANQASGAKAPTSAPKAQTPPRKLKDSALPGGKGEGKPDSAFKKDSLKQGMKVESEHTSDKAVQKEIAKDHLTEDPKYYKKLSRMERKNTDIKKKKKKKWVKGEPKPFNKGNRWRMKQGPRSGSSDVLEQKKAISEAKIEKERQARLRKG